MHKFECCELRVPAKYESLLLQIFGPKYMELPPIENRNSGHTLTEINLGEYQEVIEALYSANTDE